MSTKKEDMQNVANSLISGFIATPTEDNKVINVIPKKAVDKKEVITSDATNKGKYKNGVNLNNNYTITFKIDADIEEYLKNIEKITFIESNKSGKIESITRTEFVNNLIREQMYKLIGVKSSDDEDTINNKWLEYKNNNNL